MESSCKSENVAPSDLELVSVLFVCSHYTNKKACDAAYDLEQGGRATKFMGRRNVRT